MIRFETENFRPVSYLESHGAAMLDAMACSGRVPGALKGPDVALALASLEKAVGQAEKAQVADVRDDDEDQDRAVQFKIRAQPLIELLRAAIADEAYVTWENA